MLRNRTRAVTCKQALMADQSSQSSSHQNHTKPIPSFFVSPRFRAFTAKPAMSEADSLISPTSILEAKPFSPFANPFICDRNQPDSPKLFFRNKRSSDTSDGLALVNKLDEETTVLFGAKLRVEVPAHPPSTVSSANSPISESKTTSSPPVQTNHIPTTFTAREMELSEEYTCVISRGPNPRTTHIFNNCIVENHCSLSKNFLSFCHTCRRNLEQKNDIYIYRGEKAFCSHECRCKEMMLDGVEIF